MPTVASAGTGDVNSGLSDTVPGAGQLDEAVMVFVSRVTAPARARRRPSTVAAVFAVIDCRAMTVPWNCASVPSVAELPTCQKTLQEFAPPVMTIDVAEPMIRVDAAWNTHTERALPSRVRMPLSERERSPPE